MLILRELSKTIQSALRTFPAVVLTGPRQSGKTTLLRKLLPGKNDYASLEDLDTRMQAQRDPRGFLESYRRPLILDEIQYVPELLSYIKTKIDEKRKPGQWLLTGSQNFSLMAGVSQSLAGRAAVFHLLGLSAHEKGKRLRGLEAEMLTGTYPEVCLHRKVNPKHWFSSYIQTYLERDVRQILNVGDLSSFEKFLHLLAGRSGQILNMSSLATDAGVSVPTIKRWISVLESSYQIFLLQPYFENFNKRAVKNPKIYFLDTGVLLHLRGIESHAVLKNELTYGHLFETWVVSEVVRQFFNQGIRPPIYYFRDNNGYEIDLLIDREGALFPYEIKSVKTLKPETYRHLVKFKTLSKRFGAGGVICRAPSILALPDGLQAIPWNRFDFGEQLKRYLKTK